MVNGNITIRQSAYDFLLKFNRNYETILYRFRDRPIIAYFHEDKEFKRDSDHAFFIGWDLL